VSRNQAKQTVLGEPSTLKHLIANTLVALLLVGFLAPLAKLARASDDVPACCRRNGKHRCVATMGVRAGALDLTPTFRNLTPACPYRSHPSQLTGTRTAPRIPVISIWLSSNDAVESHRRTIFDSHHGSLAPTRGPPVTAVLIYKLPLKHSCTAY